MNYKPRPGIVKVKICGMNVLVPTREAAAYCTTLQVLPTLWSATWEAFGRGTTIDKAVPVFEMLTKRPPEQCRERLERFCRVMVERGFFLEVPEEAEEAAEPAEGTTDESPETGCVEKKDE